jgi:predicted esterase
MRAMADKITAHDIEQQYHQSVARQEYAQALRLATEKFDVFPPHTRQVVYYWRIHMACKVGDARLALATLREALERGHWFNNLDDNPDFQLLAGSDEYRQLADLSAQRRAQAIANSRPGMKILEPEGITGPTPLVFALHGNSGNSEAFAPHWEAARAHGWLVALPQSPQENAPGTFSWNDWEWATQTLTGQFSQVCAQYPVDRRRLVLGGFSMGAGLALWLALERTFEVRGLICVAPFLPDVEALKEVLALPANRGTRIYLVASEMDQYCLEVAQKLAVILPDYGIEHRLDIYTDIGHAFPPSFEPKIPGALDFILSGA